ncbi:hypothetical protein F5Y04DRAFT_135783 [Hypomontagnella monticulosa]|nr:hypothetical protein F5Y04DRAFT_135783 [Hypomontagnella monticulosa]
METAITSFTARRPATHALPHFHLPVPTPPIDVHVPRVTGIDGLSPLSSSTNSGSSQNSQPGIPPYSSHSNWSLSGSSSYTYGSMSHGGSLMQQNYNRHAYPPAGNIFTRSSESPATTDPLTGNAFDSGHPPFSLPVRGGGGNGSAIAIPQSSSQNHHPSPMMNNHSQGSHPPTPPATAQPDPYSRPQTTSSYYPATAAPTPHQPSFPPFSSSHSSFSSSHSSSSHAPPITTGALRGGITSLSPQQHHSPMQPPHFQSRQYSYPSLPPTMGGAVLSNMQNPGGQVALIGGMGSVPHGYSQGHLMGTHAMYAHGQPNHQQDRPFKCDQCPQSFNRNHDLKRHKRIHLAIKPFPCTFCEKSFSRKDALKRHRLVKGCGKGMDSPNGVSNGSPREEIKHDPDRPSTDSIDIKDESV